MKRWLPILLLSLIGAPAQQPSTATALVQKEIKSLRSLPDDKRADVTRRLALQIRTLTEPTDRLLLAMNLSSLATEGDFGHATLQEVATTLLGAIRDAHPQTSESYEELARLVHFEHVKASLGDPEFAAAMSRLEDTDRVRRNADFTLRDLRGSEWSLKKLRGKVVLVNFWATWCPPCRKEMPDLDKIYTRFSKQGLVILALSDEKEDTVRRFLAEHEVNYTILIDPGRKVHDQLRVQGIPQTLVYDRDGKLVAQAADMRTLGQFLEMLNASGLE